MDAAHRRSFSVFFPKTPSGPRSGRAGAIAAEHSCPAGQAGLLQPCAERRAGIATGAI